jgi:amidophosphoribosyltransferase
MIEAHEWNHECGVFGAVGHPRAAELAYLGLYALQHRGQEGAGIISYDGRRYHEHKKLGMVSDIFSATALQALHGASAIGHTRYSTTGSTVLPNVQPLVAKLRQAVVALAHNGNLVDARIIRSGLEDGGAIFQTSMDSEVILHLMARSRHPQIERQIGDALDRIHGAYSLLLLVGDTIYAAKDPRAIRPLCLGSLSGGGWVVASETCALDIVDATFTREIGAGEIVRVRAGERPLTVRRAPADADATCIFEAIYFSRPDSALFGRANGASRVALGRRLAAEAPCPSGEVVISVPDSSNAAAQGYAEASAIPFGHGLIRNHYIGRTFIKPTQEIRDLSARIKYNPVRDVVEGRSVVVVDDSIVRGTTVRKLVAMLRGAGAREVHFRVSSAPIIAPCYYGIDTPDAAELIAAAHDHEAIRGLVGADTLHYLSLDGMQEVIRGTASCGFCTACFDGSYPVPILERTDKKILETS